MDLFLVYASEKFDRRGTGYMSTQYDTLAGVFLTPELAEKYIEDTKKLIKTMPDWVEGKGSPEIGFYIQEVEANEGLY
jgi:hypothetical protein